MLRTRVIPVLLLKNKGFYKGVRFKNHKYVGDPINTVRLFNDKEVDEIVILDVESSRYNKKIDFDLLGDIATEAFMPLAYGGGIKNFNDAKRIFQLGVEKLILSTSAVENPDLIKQLVSYFGSQSIVLSLDVKKNIWGQYVLYIKSASHKVELDPILFAKKMQSIGVGEVLVNAINKDGLMNGYDLKFIQLLSKELNIPIVACGGAGSLSDLKKAKDHGADAVAAGSLFVFNGIYKAVLISYPRYANLSKLLGEF